MRANEPATTGNDNRTEVRRRGLARHGDRVRKKICAELLQDVLQSCYDSPLANEVAKNLKDKNTRWWMFFIAAHSCWLTNLSPNYVLGKFTVSVCRCGYLCSGSRTNSPRT